MTEPRRYSETATCDTLVYVIAREAAVARAPAGQGHEYNLIKATSFTFYLVLDRWIVVVNV